MTVSELLYRALRLAGAVQLSGRTASASEMSDAFNTLNSLIDGWNAEGLTVHAITRSSFSLQANVGQYTIGAGGDFNVTRPPKIEAAHGIVGTPVVEPPIKICTAPEWAAVALKGETSNLGPRNLFYEATHPLGKIYFHPVPSAAMSVALYLWKPLAQFANQSETVNLPSGYLRAVEYNLAVELSLTPRFRRFAMDAGVAAKAAEFKQAIRELNAGLNFGMTPAAQEPSA
jgi:hypothetical protein